MVIRRALIEDADVVGEVHSVAWKQTYQGVFDQEYLDSDSILVFMVILLLLVILAISL